VITAIASGTVAIIGIMNIRIAVLLFVFLIPFIPRSLGIPLGSQGGSLTFSRIVIPLLIIILLLKSRRPGRVGFDAGLGFVKKAFTIIAALSFVKILSATYNETAILYAVDDAVRTFGTMTFFFLIGHRVSFKKISRVFLTALFISGGLSVLELLLQSPLHSTITTEGVLEARLEGSLRDGQYRVQALFDGVLFFSEFIVICFAAFLHLMPRLNRTTNVTVYALFGFLMVANGSRSVLAAVSVIVVWAGLLFLWRRAQFLGRASAFLVVIFVLPSIIAVGAHQIQSLGGGNAIADLHSLEPFERSSTVRAWQFFQVGSILAENPILGVGFKQSYVGAGQLLALDNYYLRVGLESGILGLGLFISFFYVIISGLLRIAGDSKSPDMAHLSRSLLLLTAGFLAFRLFFQDPSGLIFYFLLLGAGLRELASGSVTPRS